jgi:hypothetical protein
LKHILGQTAVAEIAAEIAVQLALVAADQNAEGLRFAGLEAGHEFLIGPAFGGVKVWHVPLYSPTRLRADWFTIR